MRPQPPLHLVGLSAMALACAGGGRRGLPTDPEQLQGATDRLVAAEHAPTEFKACEVPLPAAADPPYDGCYPLDLVDWDRTTVCTRDTATGSHIPAESCRSLRAYVGDLNAARFPERRRAGTLVKEGWESYGPIVRSHVVLRAAPNPS